jgi:hypothetical protein
LAHYNTHQNYYGHQKYPPQQSATFLLFFLLFFADEKGNLSPALTEQFLPARAALLADYWQKTTKRIAEKWRFAEVV